MDRELGHSQFMKSHGQIVNDVKHCTFLHAYLTVTCKPHTLLLLLFFHVSTNSYNVLRTAKTIFTFIQLFVDNSRLIGRTPQKICFLCIFLNRTKKVVKVTVRRGIDYHSL